MSDSGIKELVRTEDITKTPKMSNVYLINDDFKNLVEQINNEEEDSINKFYQKDYKTFRKLIEGYGTILEENGSILEKLKDISKTSSVGSLLSYFLDNGDLEGIFDED